MLIHVLEKVDSVHKDMGIIRESQIRAEADWKYHIKRTDELEKRIRPLFGFADLFYYIGLLGKSILRFFRVIK